MPNLNLAVFMLFLALMLAICASKCPRIRIKNLRPKYQSQRRIVYFRCKRGFDLIGANSAVCNDDKWSTEFPLCIAPGCPLLDYDENVLDVTYTYRGSLATFQCKTSYVMEDEDNRVYCNKVEWNKPPPVCTKNSLKKSCNYEDGICGWAQDKGDQFDWEIHSKETTTKYTGPVNDHTYGNISEGHYIYTEASSPRRRGDQARLLSPLYNFKMQSVCFEFWFHMWCPSSPTKEFASLQVYAIPENKHWSSFAPLQTLTGDYGDSWNRERIQIEPMQESFQVILQVTHGLNHQNDIGVDDVRLWEGLCDDAPNFTYPLPPSTNIVTKAQTLSPSSEGITTDTVQTGKEAIPTTVSIQSRVITSTIKASAHEVLTGEEIGSITTQATSKENMVTQPSSSTETKNTEKRIPKTNTNTSETTDFISHKMMVSSSMPSVSVSEAENQKNLSDGFTFEQSSSANIEGKITAKKNSGDKTQNYTPLAIGITVALLFGIFVIFFIVWVWARNQDRKRTNAEDEEETQPITNAGSSCSLQNGL